MIWPYSGVRTAPGRDVNLRTGRLVVFDLETTGLNPSRALMISAGAVVVEAGAVALGQGFRRHLLQARVSSNQATLAHRLTADDLAAAESPQQVLPQLLRFIADSPCFAYHAEFDRKVLDRACRAHLKQRFDHAVIDVADLLLWLHPELGPQPPSLDACLKFLRISVIDQQRHDALTDAALTAQVLIVLLNQAREREPRTVGDLQCALARSRALRAMR